jgi:hypothetical protein
MGEEQSHERIFVCSPEDTVSRNDNPMLELAAVVIRMTGLEVIHLVIAPGVHDVVTLSFFLRRPNLLLV